MSFFSKTRLKATELFEDSFEYLQRTYDQAIEVFTPASPFGQILTVVSNLGEMIFFYIEAALTELNISRARNIESIYGLSRLTGHDPTRGISARGIIGLRLNTSASTLLNGDFVQIMNGASFEIGQNGLKYYLKFNSDFIRLDKTNKQFVNVEVIQGEKDEQSFTGSGNPLQSYNLTTKDPTDQYLVDVFVDGELWKKVDSLYDMNNGEKTVMVKTSVNGGLSLFFGNNQFGRPPALGSRIRCTYVKTRGAAGNIGGKQLDIKFIDPGTDSSGEQVDLNEILAMNITRNPMFGSDSEDPNFTRLIAPYQSNSFVLANPNNYIYYLSKYDFWSFIDAYNTKNDEYIDDDNIIYLFLIPDVKKKLTSDLDYFSVPEVEFTMTTQEKAMTYEILNKSGRQVVTAETRIVDPVIKKYALNVVIRWFENYDKDAIRIEIRKNLDEYFLNVNRRDRIPRSDIISIIENVDGIDSVNVFFISEENEKAIKDGFYFIPVYGTDPITDQKVLIENKKIVLKKGEDPQLGLDSFGDVIIENNDIAIIRGGWKDRNGTYYEPIPEANKISSLNVFYKEAIVNNLYNKIQQEKYNQTKRNRGTTIATGANSAGLNTGRLETTPTLKALKGK
uniref:Uncharacterized protein n=1 Tax=Virus NIOZ-UU157 TaxID=2763269 RepID=A0A7S9SS74_9VIRU|nr:MAG: hypothetical protein NIOZUU157_00185 [Virus NIOZ-UU157]